MPVSISLLFLSGLLAALSVLPYVTYQRQLLIGDWVLFCIIRPVTYYFIFLATWHKLLTRKNNHWGSWLRIVLSILFGAVYTTLYTMKWIEAENILISYVALPCLSTSWFLVYYEVMDRYITSRTSVDALDLRRKRLLLLAIREQEKASWFVPDFAAYAAESLTTDKSCSVLVCKHTDAHLRTGQQEEVRLGFYENEFYDAWIDRIAALVGLEVGFSMIPLTLSVVEDYGYSIYKLVGDTDAFLVIVFIFCVVFSILYLMTTHPIYQGMLRSGLLLFRDPREVILSFCRRVVLFFLASITALTRVNSSYSIFGSIAGRMEVPVGIGLFLVWCAVLVVALVDFSSTLKILSRSVKYLCMIALVQVREMGWERECTCFGSTFLRRATDRALTRFYSKKLKREVRNATAFELSTLVDCLL